MKIGVIGAGAAGLATAWLLDSHHEVTLIEKQDRLGGHAHTIDVEQDGNCIPIEAGFEFFSDTMFPVFSRLLDILGVAVRRYPATATVYPADGRDFILLPPIRNGRVIWSACKPRSLHKLVQFRQVLNEAAPLVEARDTTITLEQFLDGLKLAESFKNELLYPFLLAQWCVELEEFKTFAAYNVLKYVVMYRSGGMTAPTANEIVGGARTYIQALAGALTRARVRTGVSVRRIGRSADGYLVEDSGGHCDTFDHLVIATGARDACALLADLEEAESVRRELRRIDYFETTIAVHADRRFMPPQEKYWSVVNARYENSRSHNTIWKSWKSKKPIFRSWLTYEARLPYSLYAVVTYDHPKVNQNYYQAQQNLARLQGQNNLWLAGVYMDDIDCHESAVMSAVKIARQLAPTSPNLGGVAD